MRKKIWIAGLALVAGLGGGLGVAEAQPIVSGRVIKAPEFDPGRMLLFSQHDNIYGTSRSAAMGGAFTSLGADLSSMNINPAGLGMYQSSDWGFTQALSIDGMRTTSPHMRPGTLAAGGNRVSYGLNNFGAAYNVFTGSGSLTSLTLGFSYNRAANFNSRTSVETFGEESTIADMFARQIGFMVGAGVPQSALEPSANPWENLDILLDEWGAVLGWQTDLVGPNDDGGYGFYTNTLPADSYFRSTTKGGIYEYNFSLGANLSNILYIGATVGLTDISYIENSSYGEIYPSGASLSGMRFDQNTQIKGSGVTAKLGLVVRPVEALRLGVAFHLPTYYTLQHSYDGAMNTGRYNTDTGLPLMDEVRFNTAPRLLAGISGIIADRAIVALDWEMTWYDKIRKRSEFASEIDSSKAESRALYNPAQSFRAGLEFRLNDAVSLRAGGTYTMDFMRDKGFVTNNPTPKSGFSITGGAGFNLGTNGYLDVAYVFNRSCYTDYELYYYKEETENGPLISSQFDASGVAGQVYDRTYTPTRNRHMITLTLGSRF